VGRRPRCPPPPLRSTRTLEVSAETVSGLLELQTTAGAQPVCSHRFSDHGRGAGPNVDCRARSIKFESRMRLHSDRS
jgi:hypothetical protein